MSSPEQDPVALFFEQAGKIEEYVEHEKKKSESLWIGFTPDMDIKKFNNKSKYKDPKIIGYNEHSVSCEYE